MPQWLIDFGNWLYDIAYAAVATVGVVISDILLTILDGFFIIGQLALDGVALTLQGLDLGDYLTLLPDGTRAYLSAIGITEAMGIIIAAIIARLLLQLIPFVRLGS